MASFSSPVPAGLESKLFSGFWAYTWSVLSINFIFSLSVTFENLSSVKSERTYLIINPTIIDTIKNEFKPEPCRDEPELQKLLKVFLNVKFGDKKVEREVRTHIAPDIPEGKIDFLIDDEYVIELKLARDSHTLQGFLGQLLGYQKVYPQIAALLLFDNTKMSVGEVNHFVKEYSKQKISSIVVEGKITKRGRKKLTTYQDTD